MPKNSESLNRTLFDLLHTRGYDPTMLDTSGKEIPTPEEAEVFQFNFVKDGEDYGKVTMSIDGAHKLIIYFNDEIANSEKEESESSDLSWYKLLNQLKRFAQSYQLSFELRNVDNLKHDMAKREYMKKKESIAEGYYPMGKKASYSDAVPNVKMVIQHSRQIEEGEQRYRNVARIFLENEHGERFLAPTTKPGIARVYARHIAEGGMPHDDRWNHIGSLCEEYQKMGAFVRATRNGQFNESAQKLVTEGINHYNKLRESLTKLAGHRGYNTYFESYTPALMEDEESVDLSEMFMSSSLDPRIESAMPILAKLSKNISEMSEVGALAEWADSLLEGGGGGEASEEPVEPMVSEEESLTSNNPGGIPEGRLDGDEDIDSPVANAITRRILMRHTDLLAKYGPEKVSDAIAEVVDYLGDWIGLDDEIGSSDVSNWVKRVGWVLQARALDEGEPGDLEHELERQDYERDRERDEQAEKELDEEKPGLWANIHAKRERIKHGSGEKMRKPGSKGAPSAQDFKDATKEGLGDVAKKVGGALKTGAKAIGKAIVGPDDDELLAKLKRDAGVRNPENGKPSMAHSDVEKVDEEGVAEGSLEEAHHGALLNPKKGKFASVIFQSMWDSKPQIDYYDNLDDAKFSTQNASAYHGSVYAWNGTRWIRKMSATERGSGYGYGDSYFESEQGVAEGEFAGNYATGEAGQWRNKGPKANKPATIGDFVGESQLDEMDKSEDSKGPEGKAKPITAKKAVSDAEKIMNKAHNKMMKSMSDKEKVDKGYRNPNMKEGQEDLNAIMRLLGK